MKPLPSNLLPFTAIAIDAFPTAHQWSPKLNAGSGEEW